MGDDMVALEHARHEEQLKTAFKRIEELTAFKSAIESEIALLKEAINKNKIDQLNFEKTVSLQISGLSSNIELAINNAVDKIRDDKIEQLEESLARKDKFNFWLMTSVLGTIITVVITAYLNSK